MIRKALFVHDGPLFSYDKGIYGIHYKNELVERYSFFGKKVSFLMREISLDSQGLDKYSKIDHPDFNFIPIPNFKSLKSLHNKNKARNLIHKAVETHDVIIVRLPSAAGVIAFKEAKKLNKPVLVEFVACVFDALWNYDWRGKILAKYKFKQYQNLMQDATHTVYVTNAFLQSRYPSPGKSIGCSDVELQVIDEEVLTLRLQKIKEKTNPLKLATIAAIDVAYKAQADVVKAIAALKLKNIYFEYDIIGQGNPDVLQKLLDTLDINDLVKIKGSIPHDQIFEKLKSIDIYIQPSMVEGLPRAVVEAMSMACPVIGSNVGGIPELIITECLYPKGDITALAGLLTEVNENFLIKNAELNFEKAKEYQKSYLDHKRLKFYKEFLEDYGIGN
jgi:glycosyltransferase involved in cell wall biosynthesis